MYTVRGVVGGGCTCSPSYANREIRKSESQQSRSTETHPGCKEKWYVLFFAPVDVSKRAMYRHVNAFTIRKDQLLKGKAVPGETRQLDA